MDKKGVERSTERTIFFLGILAICALAVFAFANFIADSINDTSFWRNAYAKDLGLGMDMLLAADGKVQLEYDLKEVEPLLFLWVDENSVRLNDYSPKSDQQRLKETATWFRYGKNELFKPYDLANGGWKDVKLSTKFFTIQKNYNSLTFEPEVLKRQLCSDIDTKYANAKVFLKPEDMTENNVKMRLERQIEVSDNPSRNNFVGLKIEHDDAMTNDVITYHYYSFDFEKLNKLICLINNEIVDNNPTLEIVGVNLIEMDKEETKKFGLSEVALKMIFNQQLNDFSDEIADGVIAYLS